MMIKIEKLLMFIMMLELMMALNFVVDVNVHSVVDGNVHTMHVIYL